MHEAICLPNSAVACRRGGSTICRRAVAALPLSLPFWASILQVAEEELNESLVEMAAASDRPLSRMFSEAHSASPSARCCLLFAVALRVGGPGGTFSPGTGCFASTPDSVAFSNEDYTTQFENEESRFGLVLPAPQSSGLCPWRSCCFFCLGACSDPLHLQVSMPAQSAP